ncbi:MAG: hypothetical protein KAI18_01415 [Candidatus Aenigmarchaeota archaeon]|nr:hypothetical protein [Candidatus Aenigmarchaeota archaeon]
MIERTIEKITDTERKIEKDISRLEKRWDLKLKSEKITNLQKLKEHKRTVKKKMEIQKTERLKFIEKEILDMDKETDKNIRQLEERYKDKKKEMLTLIAKDLDTEDKK